MDDEYFKTMMVFKDRAGDHPEVQEIRDSVFRSLRMVEKVKFTRRLPNSVRQVEITTSRGIYVGKAPGFDVDLARLNRVVARITRGLYWHHHQHICLPNDFTVDVYPEYGIQSFSKETRKGLRKTLIQPILNNPVHKNLHFTSTQPKSRLQPMCLSAGCETATPAQNSCHD
jgi:hypothetical protein